MRYQHLTCIEFVEFENEAAAKARTPDYEVTVASDWSTPRIIEVTVADLGACYVESTGAFKKVNLGFCDGFDEAGSIIHELGHAVGMNHEQKRPDATSDYHGKGPYITINWENVPERDAGGPRGFDPLVDLFSHVAAFC
jgi:hypothetical protein